MADSVWVNEGRGEKKRNEEKPKENSREKRKEWMELPPLPVGSYCSSYFPNTDMRQGEEVQIKEV